MFPFPSFPDSTTVEIDTMAASTVISKDTLLPIGVVISVIIAVGTLVWQVASDRERAYGLIRSNAVAIERHEKALESLRCDMAYVKQAMERVEAKLGTRPKEQSHP